MFGKKAKKIKELTELTESYHKYYARWREAADARDSANVQITNLTAQLQFSEEETQKLREKNRDLQIRLELLQSVLKQLNIPVKLKK